MKKRVLITTCAALLAACNPAAQESEATNDAAPQQTAADQPAEGGGDSRSDDAAGSDAGNRASEPTSPTASDRPVTSIPAGFRGRWGETIEACAKLVEDRDGVMSVTSNELHFSKLRAEVTKITLRSPSRVSINATVDEPGRNFTFATDLVLADGGNVLIREEEGPRARYLRCPRRSD